MQTQTQVTFPGRNGSLTLFVVGERSPHEGNRLLLVTKVKGSAAVFGVDAEKCKGADR